LKEVRNYSEAWTDQRLLDFDLSEEFYVEKS